MTPDPSSSAPAAAPSTAAASPTTAPRTMIMTGNQAAAWGAFLARVQVISAYPITPQTSIIETLAELMPKATWPSKFVTVESEHSALSVCIGASVTGARTFTATSSQGLALMHELLHWASGGRLPIVLVDVNRAMAPGWNIWTDQNDSLSQRDTGVAQIYCSNAQDTLDHVVIAFRLAEMLDVPVMVVEDAFVLSHTAEAVEVPAETTVAAFLPTRKPRMQLDVDHPAAFGGLLGPDVYQEVREALHRSLERIQEVAPAVYREWEKLTGRSYDLVEAHHVEGARVVLVASGTVAETARELIESDWARREKVGLVQMRWFRPFPSARVREVLAGIPKIAVVDRNCSYGHGGIFFQELKSALYGLPDAKRPEAYGYVAGLGGRDISLDVLQTIVRRTLEREEAEPETEWIGATLPATKPEAAAMPAAPACACHGAGANGAAGDASPPSAKKKKERVR